MLLKRAILFLLALDSKHYFIKLLVQDFFMVFAHLLQVLAIVVFGNVVSIVTIAFGLPAQGLTYTVMLLKWAVLFLLALDFMHYLIKLLVQDFFMVFAHLLQVLAIVVFGNVVSIVTFTFGLPTQGLN